MHWTPVHLDVVVPDIDHALERAVAAGATRESEIETDEHRSWVACADPFGHGFCLIRPRMTDGVAIVRDGDARHAHDVARNPPRASELGIRHVLIL